MLERSSRAHALAADPYTGADEARAGQCIVVRRNAALGSAAKTVCGTTGRVRRSMAEVKGRFASSNMNVESPLLSITGWRIGMLES
jgi:hypothetical protein